MKKVSDFEALSSNPYQDKLKPCFKLGWRRIDPDKVKPMVDTDSGETVFLSEIGNVKLVINDITEFTKLFAAAYVELPKLTAPGLKMLTYLCSIIKKDVDWVRIEPALALEWCGFKSRTHVYNGIISLLDTGFICRKTGGNREYYINVNYFFNGKRINLEAGHDLKSRLIDDAKKGRLNLKKVKEDESTGIGSDE